MQLSPKMLEMQCLTFVQKSGMLSVKCILLHLFFSVIGLLPFSPVLFSRAHTLFSFLNNPTGTGPSTDTHKHQIISSLPLNFFLVCFLCCISLRCLFCRKKNMRLSFCTISLLINLVVIKMSDVQGEVEGARTGRQSSNNFAMTFVFSEKEPVQFI